MHVKAKKNDMGFKLDFHHMHTHTHTHASPGLELAGSADMITPGSVLSDRHHPTRSHYKINQNYVHVSLSFPSFVPHPSHFISKERHLEKGSGTGR